MDREQLTKRVQASVLLEVVIAMVAIMAVFGIAMMIYANVLRLSLSAKKIQAQASLRQVLIKDEQNPGNISRDTSAGDLYIEQDTAGFAGASGLRIIKLTAYDQNRQKIAFLQKIIPLKP